MVIIFEIDSGRYYLTPDGYGKGFQCKSIEYIEVILEKRHYHHRGILTVGERIKEALVKTTCITIMDNEFFLEKW